MEYLEKSGRVWEKETVLPPLGLDMPLATGEQFLGIGEDNTSVILWCVSLSYP